VDAQDGVSQALRRALLRQAVVYVAQAIASGTETSVTTFIVTYNPARWDWDPADRRSIVRRTARGSRVRGRWSTGNRNSGVVPKQDRVFLLRQGSEPRGIIGSGTLTSGITQKPHWDGTPGKIANYAEILWDRMLDDDELLPLDDVQAAVGGVSWDRIQGGGIVLPPPADAALERVWAEHLGAEIVVPGAAAPGKRSRGQAWQADPDKRREVEDHAQEMLEKHYRAKRWKVEDTRRGNPYDAKATKGTQVRYLEAKGTETDGVTVKVTSGEVDFARTHPGECVLGVVSGIRFLEDGTLDKASGDLKLYDWDPDTGALKPTAYDWKPPKEQA
jgi:hypothetical protein